MAYEVLKEFAPAGHAFNGDTFWEVRVTVVSSSGATIYKISDRCRGTLEHAHDFAGWLAARAGF